MQSVIVQDFLIRIRAADNMHPQIKETLFNGLASSEMIKVSEENTQYGETASVGGIVVKVNVTTVKVLAPIELMFSLKRAMPFWTSASSPAHWSCSRASNLQRIEMMGD